MTDYTLQVKNTIHQRITRSHVLKFNPLKIQKKQSFIRQIHGKHILEKDGQAFDNMVYISYAGDDYIKCQHKNSYLTGIYKSPIFDLTASGRYLVYILSDIVVVGAGTTWDDLVPAPNTWDMMGVSQSWEQIVNLPDAPVIKMRLNYGDTLPLTNTVEKLEILSAIVTGRYYQVEIEITDPTSEINAYVGAFTLKFCQ